MYYEGHDGIPESDILDTFHVWMKNIFPQTQLAVEGLQCQKPLGSKELELTVSFISRADLKIEELNYDLCSISEPQHPNSFRQELQFLEILSSVVENLKKKGENK